MREGRRRRSGSRVSMKGGGGERLSCSPWRPLKGGDRRTATKTKGGGPCFPCCWWSHLESSGWENRNKTKHRNKNRPQPKGRNVQRAEEMSNQCSYKGDHQATASQKYSPRRITTLWFFFFFLCLVKRPFLSLWFQQPSNSAMSVY